VSQPDRTHTALPSVVDSIGQTPLVELSRLAAGIDGRIVAKFAYLNPGSSKKERTT
jgi:cysteine synthase A